MSPQSFLVSSVFQSLSSSLTPLRSIRRTSPLAHEFPVILPSSPGPDGGVQRPRVDKRGVEGSGAGSGCGAAVCHGARRPDPPLARRREMITLRLYRCVYV